MKGYIVWEWIDFARRWKEIDSIHIDANKARARAIELGEDSTEIEIILINQ